MTFIEKAILTSIIGNPDRLLDDLNEMRRADINYVKYPIDWNEYADYIDTLKALEKKSYIIITNDNCYFFIGECEYNAIREDF